MGNQTGDMKNHLPLAGLLLLSSAHAVCNCSCNQIYQRCTQTPQMSLASGAPFQNLDPSIPNPNLPPVLSIPISPLEANKLLNDKTALEAYFFHDAAGNYDYCKTIQGAHYCHLGMMKARQTDGPFFGQCLPTACSVEDYRLLGTNCTFDRIERTIHIAEYAIELLNQSLDRLNQTQEQQLLKMTNELLGLQLTKNKINAFDKLAIDNLPRLSGHLSNFSGGTGGYCDDDYETKIDTSAGFLIAFSVSLGFLCGMSTVYELLVLPHVINAQPAFSYDKQAARDSGMAWLQTLRPEHSVWIKSTRYSSPMIRLASIFSMYSQTMNLLNKRTAGDFKALNGIRVLSTGYIVLGHLHEVFALILVSVNTVPALFEFATSFRAIVVLGSFLSVDTFYFLSGFLGAYIMTRSIERLQSWVQFLKAYPVLIAHRYLRLTPIYAYVLWWFVAGTPLLITGPNVGNALKQAVPEACQDWHWVENLLYVNSWLPLDKHGTDTCMGWSWYLANDFMYYCIMPFVLFAYCQSKKLGIALIAAFILENVVCVLCLTAKYELGMSQVGNPLYGKYLYSFPWTRCAPYFIGMALGIHFHEKKKLLSKSSDGPVTLKEPLRLKAFVCYVLCGFVMVLFAFILPWCAVKGDPAGVLGKGTWSLAARAAFNALQRPIYSVGLCGMVHMFASGHGSIFKYFLEHPVFDVLGSLSYGLYLWALLIMEVFARSLITPAVLKDDYLTWLYFGCMGLGFLVSYLSHVMLELPFGALTLMILPSKKKEAPAAKPLVSKDVEANELLNPPESEQQAGADAEKSL